MDLFNGLYVKFRFFKDEYTGFSPAIARYLSYSNFFQEYFIDCYNNDLFDVFYVNKLFNMVLHKIDDGVMITTRYRSPIYMITCLDLLPELLINCMISEDTIKDFFNTNRNNIISMFRNVYFQEIDDTCNRIKDMKGCKRMTRCYYNEQSGICSLSPEAEFKSKDVKRTLQAFNNELDRFEEVLIGCHREAKEDNPIPSLLYPMLLTYYWYIVRNNFKTIKDNRLIIEDVTINDWLSDYMSVANNVIPNKKFNMKQHRIDKSITNINVTIPPIVNMTTIKFRGILFPNCVETMINDFFNVLLYDMKRSNFNFDLLPATSSQKLIDFYERLNIDMVNTGKGINILNDNNTKRDFLNLVVDIPGVKYVHDGFEIESSEKDVMKVISHLTGIDMKNISDLSKLSTKYQEINVIDTKITMTHKKNVKVITLNIWEETHSYAEHKTSGNILVSEDNVANILYKIINEGDIEENISPITKFSYGDYESLFAEYKLQLPYSVYIDTEKYITFKQNQIISLRLNTRREQHRITLEDIKKCKYVQYLDLTEIDMKISDITHLQYLIMFSIFYTNMKEISDDISNLTRLKRLRILRANIEYVSPEIGKLTKLHILDLSMNKISYLPDEIDMLQNLSNVTLSYNKLSEIPTGIFRLQNLTILDLGNNMISNIDEELYNITSLENLYLNSNNISYISPNIHMLSNLRILNLEDNKISKLPIEITRLNKLIEFNIQDNNIESDINIGNFILEVRRRRYEYDMF